MYSSAITHVLSVLSQLLTAYKPVIHSKQGQTLAAASSCKECDNTAMQICSSWILGSSLGFWLFKNVLSFCNFICIKTQHNNLTTTHPHAVHRNNQLAMELSNPFFSPWNHTSFAFSPMVWLTKVAYSAAGLRGEMSNAELLNEKDYCSVSSWNKASQ